MDNATAKPLLSNVWYDRFKFLAITVLPSLGSLYFGLAQIWGLPKAEEVVGTITILVTFLGLLLQVSTIKYNKSEAKYDGVINVVETDVKKIFTLELKIEPEDIQTKKDVTLKINQPVL